MLFAGGGWTGAGTGPGTPWTPGRRRSGTRPLVAKDSLPELLPDSARHHGSRRVESSSERDCEIRRFDRAVWVEAGFSLVRRVWLPPRRGGRREEALGGDVAL